MIDLYRVINEYPDTINNGVKLKSLLLDLYPEISDRAKIKALMIAFDSNIVVEIQNSELDDSFLSRARKNIFDNFKIEKNAAEWAINQWCNAYGKSLLNKHVSFETKNSTVVEEQVISLTPAQQQAVESEQLRIAVIAGPGSGKTRVLTERICNLINNKNIKENEILALSYSSKAAKEMRKRLRDRLGMQSYKIQALTFHSFGLRVLRENAELIGFNSDLDIVNTSTKNKILKTILNDFNISESAVLEYAQHISRIKNGAQSQDKKLLAIVDAYGKELKHANLIDFDDMINLTIQLFLSNPEINEKYRNNYTHILIDEVQDLNDSQIQLVQLLSNQNTSLFVVGDDDQCIYEWRGARPDYLKNLASGQDIEVIKLQDNFRSDKAIVNVAGSLIGKNIKRIIKNMTPRKKAETQMKTKANTTIAKRFYTEADQAKFIASEIEKLVDSGDYNYCDFAILLRSAKQQGGHIRCALDTLKIPYHEQTSDETEYDEFLNVLYTVSNFNKKNGINKAVNYPVRVMDNFAYTEVCEKFGFESFMPVSEVFEILNTNGEEFEDADIFRSRYSLIKKLSEQTDTMLSHEIIRTLYDSYKSEPFANTKKVKEKLEHLENLIDIAKDFDSAYEKSSSNQTAIREFLDYLNLSAQDESSEECAESAVTVMTCHKSKGLEFPVVFVPGVQIGIFPNDYFITTPGQLEAERRLFYVSMTRAINKLYVSCYIEGAKGNDVVKNSFLEEIPNIRFQED